MSIYSGDKSYIKIVDRIIKEAKSAANSNDWQFGVYLKEDLYVKKTAVIKPVELYCQCVVSIVENPLIEQKDYTQILNYGQRVYREMFPFDEKTPDFPILANIFLEMFHEYGSITKGCFSLVIFNLFNNKMNYLKWMKSVASDIRFHSVVEICKKYGVEARSYFANEDMFTANFILICGKIIAANDPETVYKTEVKKIEHMAGIYEVDEAMIMEAEQQIAAARATIDRSRDVLALVDERMKTIDTMSEHAVDRVKQITSTEVELAQGQINTLDARMRDAYDKFLDTQRERVLFEKNELVNQVVAESEVKLEEFRQNIRSIVNMAKLELSKINQESGIVMAKLEGFMKDDTKIKELMKSGAEQKKLMNKLERLMLLNDNNLELLEAQVQREAELQKQESAAAEAASVGTTNVNMNGGIPTDTDQKGTSKTGKGKNASSQQLSATTQTTNVVYTAVVGNAAQTGQGPVMVMSNPEDTQPDMIPAVNPLLDESIDFKDRYEAVKKRKKEMEKRGEHFHKMFDDVLIAVMENANPYLIGPSGCGKTYMVGQICKLLDSSFIDIGYINEEYDILGFQTANGGYSRPNFYRCYKYGKIAFCDELDNGNSRATVKLNSFLSNTADAGYNFPNGEHVNRHGSFRIIAAGNTAGNGADSVYNTREKIEESVQQRFTPIYVGYDNSVEQAILGTHEDWFEFVVIFREATDAWSKKSHSVASGIITTRDTARINKYLENGSFSMEKIIDYEFIQTKDESYLAFLAEHIKANVAKESPARKIADCFLKKVEAIRNGEVDR